MEARLEEEEDGVDSDHDHNPCSSSAHEITESSIAADKTSSDIGSKLRVAANTGNIGDMALLLDHGADPNQGKAEDGYTALIWAAIEGNYGCVELLLDRNADPNLACGNGGTALMAASYFGNNGCVQLLLGRTSDAGRGMHETGLTALMSACKNGHAECARTLIRHSADVNQVKTNNGATALMCCAERGHIEVTRLLLNAGADPNVSRSTDGATALISAADSGHARVAALLLDSGADPNKASADNGSTALMSACQECHIEVVQLLTIHGADPDVTVVNIDGGELTARTLAQHMGHRAVVDWLDMATRLHRVHIAVRSRLTAAARSALGLGRLDPAGCSLRELLELGTESPATMNLGQCCPLPVCVITVAFVHDALAPWSPSRHRLFHVGFRRAIRSVLLVARRHKHGSKDGKSGRVSAFPVLPVLPNELWLLLCSFLVRASWTPDPTKREPGGACGHHAPL